MRLFDDEFSAESASLDEGDIVIHHEPIISREELREMVKVEKMNARLAEAVENLKHDNEYVRSLIRILHDQKDALISKESSEFLIFGLERLAFRYPSKETVVPCIENFENVRSRASAIELAQEDLVSFSKKVLEMAINAIKIIYKYFLELLSKIEKLLNIEIKTEEEIAKVNKYLAVKDFYFPYQIATNNEAFGNLLSGIASSSGTTSITAQDNIFSTRKRSFDKYVKGTNKLLSNMVEDQVFGALANSIRMVNNHLTDLKNHYTDSVIDLVANSFQDDFEYMGHVRNSLHEAIGRSILNGNAVVGDEKELRPIFNISNDFAFIDSCVFNDLYDGNSVAWILYKDRKGIDPHLFRFKCGRFNREYQGTQPSNFGTIKAHKKSSIVTLTATSKDDLLAVCEAPLNAINEVVELKNENLVDVCRAIKSSLTEFKDMRQMNLTSELLLDIAKMQRTQNLRPVVVAGKPLENYVGDITFQIKDIMESIWQVTQCADTEVSLYMDGCQQFYNAFARFIAKPERNQ